MLVSGSEPARLKDIGEVSGVPERYGCDFLITSGEKLTGVQRKKFPEDLIASLADGRLVDQLRLMQKLDRKLLILEGRGQWTLDGVLIGNQWKTFTLEQLFGLVYSLAFEFGVQILWVSSVIETIAALRELEVWASKKAHVSLLNRPNPSTDAWGRRSKEAWLMHFVQGFPQIGPVTARNILEAHGGRLPIRWDLDSQKDLEMIPGIGKGKAKDLWEMLNDPPESSTQ